MFWDTSKRTPGASSCFEMMLGKYTKGKEQGWPLSQELKLPLVSNTLVPTRFERRYSATPCAGHVYTTRATLHILLVACRGREQISPLCYKLWQLRVLFDPSPAALEECCG